MKKLIFSLAFCALLSSNVFANSFPDVSESHANYQAIEYLKTKGIINGYADGFFRPNDPVSRAQATKMVLKALEIYYSGNFTRGFNDVNKDDWYWEYVMVAGSLDIVEGYSDGSFKPNAAINVAENLKLLIETADKPLREVASAVFVDVPADQWFSPYADYAREKNLLDPDDEGKIKPGAAMTRADFAEFVYRFLISEETGTAFALETNWDYVKSSKIPVELKISPKWELVERSDYSVIARKDTSLSQYDLTRAFPNSAYIKMQVDENSASLNAQKYFSVIQKAFNGNFKTFDIDGMNALEVVFDNSRQVDWYIFLKNGQVLIIYSEYGNGDLGHQLQKELNSILRTLRYSELNAETNIAVENGMVVNNQNAKPLISKVLDLVLVEGKGQETLNLFSDEILIETDPIGVGTGAVDYYYTAELDYTLKYERSANVILAISKGNTAAF